MSLKMVRDLAQNEFRMDKEGTKNGQRKKRKWIKNDDKNYTKTYCSLIPAGLRYGCNRGTGMVVTG